MKIELTHEDQIRLHRAWYPGEEDVKDEDLPLFPRDMQAVFEVYHAILGERGLVVVPREPTKEEIASPVVVTSFNGIRSPEGWYISSVINRLEEWRPTSERWIVWMSRNSDITTVSGVGATDREAFSVAYAAAERETS